MMTEPMEKKLEIRKMNECNETNSDLQNILMCEFVCEMGEKVAIVKRVGIP